MCSEVVIEVNNLSKSYGLYKSSAERMKSLLFPSREPPRFEALKDISFTIGRGEFVGVIGRNGSGKSTLLQVLAGILKPSSGAVSVQGRVAAMLELGAGFNTEFTGRENARLNAHILGMSAAEIDAALPEIEAFADIGEFFDRPLTTYSSGMFVRLAFAVQASVRPDILIVDEALAVGDVFFRVKCYERLNSLREQGTTVILVTHSAEDIMFYCDRALLIDRGALIFEGDPAEAVNLYLSMGHRAVSARAAASQSIELGSNIEGDMLDFGWPDKLELLVDPERQLRDGSATMLGAGTFGADGAPRRVFRQSETVRILVEYDVHETIDTPCAGFVLRTERGLVAHGRHSGQCNSPVPSLVSSGSRIRVWHQIQLSISPGDYLVDLGLSSWPSAVYNDRQNYTMAELEGSARRHCVASSACHVTVVPPDGRGFDAQPFYGLAELESACRLTVPV